MNSKNSEKPARRSYNRKPQIEITADNYMEFSAKDLYKEIEALRKQDAGALKAEIKILKMKLTRIGNIANPQESKVSETE